MTTYEVTSGVLSLSPLRGVALLMGGVADMTERVRTAVMVYGQHKYETMRQ